MTIVSKLFKKQKVPKNDEDRLNSMNKATDINLHSSLRRCRSTKSLGSMKRSKSMTMEESLASEPVPGVPPLPIIIRKGQRQNPELPNNSAEKREENFNSTLQNSASFLNQLSHASLSNQCPSNDDYRKATIRASTPTSTRGHSRNRKSRDVRSPGFPESDSDSEFGDDGVRHPFHLENTISSFPCPPDEGDQSSLSISPTLDGKIGRRISEELESEDINLSQLEKKEGEIMEDADIKQVIAHMLGATVESPEEKDTPQHVSCNEYVMFPVGKLGEQHYPIQEVKHGRMPSLTKRRYWHLPTQPQTSIKLITEDQWYTNQTARSEEPYATGSSLSKGNLKQKKSSLLKRAKSLGLMRRPRRNSNL